MTPSAVGNVLRGSRSEAWRSVLRCGGGSIVSAAVMVPFTHRTGRAGELCIQMVQEVPWLPRTKSNRSRMPHGRIAHQRSRPRPWQFSQEQSIALALHSANQSPGVVHLGVPGSGPSLTTRALCHDCSCAALRRHPVTASPVGGVASECCICDAHDGVWERVVLYGPGG